MPPFKPSMLRSAAAGSAVRKQIFREASRRRDHALPIIPTCPAPTCTCADMPPDLAIDTSTDLNSTMAPYAEHLLVSSGQANWTSRIEDERKTAPWGELVASVKNEFGLKGRFRDPYHNVVVSTVSFETPEYQGFDHASRALLFPSFRMVDRVRAGRDEISDFIRTFLLPEKLHPAHGRLTEDETKQKTRSITDSALNSWASNVHPITSPTILICSHDSRDTRCGVLGPLLHAEFTQYINKHHTLRHGSEEFVDQEKHAISVRSFASHPKFNPNLVDSNNHTHRPVNVGMISHIGGHKFAGNVILYIPPDYQCHPLRRVRRGAKPKDVEEAESLSSTTTSTSSLPREGDTLESKVDNTSPLAGTGIWYGRVEPRHVEGIVEQTLCHGRIIKDLFRGGIKQDGSQIRLPLY